MVDNIYAFRPYGVINFYRFVPLDNTYTNTLHFKTINEQRAYFGLPTQEQDEAYQKQPELIPKDMSQAQTAEVNMKLHYTGQTFTRNERQYIKIDRNVCDLMDCNYITYQNLQFGRMWIFAFITNVEYINDYVTEVEFEIDVMQTFMWNYELRDCYVIREHSKTDEIGDSLTPETVPILNLINRSIEKTDWFEDYSVLIYTVFDGTPTSEADMRKPVFKMISGFPCGCDITRINVSSGNLEPVQDYLQKVADAGCLEGIITAYIFPTIFTPIPTDPNPLSLQYYKVNAPLSDLNGYEPQNKKLFTYPYNFLKVDCGDKQAVYRYEYVRDISETKDIEFSFQGIGGIIPQIRCCPLSYNCETPLSGIFTDNSEALVMENFPLVTYSGDNFANWYGQNGSGIIFQAGVNVAEIAAGIALSGTGIGATVGTGLIAAGGIGLVNATLQEIKAIEQPPTPRSVGQAFGDVATKTRNFYFSKVQVCREGAEIIDDYFTMFGYAVNKIKIPEIVNYDTCRPEWNFIQATNVTYHWTNWKSSPDGKATSVPHKYQKKITQIYNTGITFWKTPYDVGQYKTYDGQPKNNKPQ